MDDVTSTSPTGPDRPSATPTAAAPATRLPRVRASELVGRGWLNTGGRTVTLADLRGRVVILDFWTFCCINCLHVLDELRDLEARFGDVLTIVGVHSPKFVHEADPVALAAAVERYEVHHPVLDDPDLVTWQAYTARAWPTLVVVDPEGYVVAQLAGEGHAASIEALVAELVAEHRAKGTLHEGDGPYVPPTPQPSTLRFPAKAVALPGGNLLVADAGHHSLAELAPDGETLVRRVGSGVRGLVDGGPDVARLAEPGGLALVPDALRDALGYDVVVADTANHVLRGVRLDDGTVTTVAGTGRQFMVGGPDNVLAPAGGAAVAPGAGGAATAGGAAAAGGGFVAGGTYPARGVRLSSPWDVAWVAGLGAFVVAMAGNHTLWAFDPVAGTVTHLAGTMNEGLQDGPGPDAWFAQPSGLVVAPAPDDAARTRVWVADSETSALRWAEPAEDGSLGVRTAVGQGLFDFGHRDGAAADALFQHPLGVAALPDGSVLVADTYNGALRRFDPATDEVSTLATGLAEPSGIVVRPAAPAPDGGPGETEVLVVESAAHRVTRVVLPPDLRGAGTTVDDGGHRTQRPVTDLAAGALTLRVPFTPAPGQKLDDRFGPSTQLSVSATPATLLVSGEGTGTDMARDLVLAAPAPGEVLEGVLHVSARAASCDAFGPDGEPVEFPACHLAQQDWGVPVRVAADGATELVLPLLG